LIKDSHRLPSSRYCPTFYCSLWLCMHLRAAAAAAHFPPRFRPATSRDLFLDYCIVSPFFMIIVASRKTRVCCLLIVNFGKVYDVLKTPAAALDSEVGLEAERKQG
jgi:hypothetical protein